jgi:hypothetical protein
MLALAALSRALKREFLITSGAMQNIFHASCPFRRESSLFPTETGFDPKTGCVG